MSFAGLTIYKSFLYILCLNFTVCLGTFVMGYYLTVYNALIPQFNLMYGWDDPDTHSHIFGLLGGFTLNFGILVSFLFGLHTLSMDEVVKGVEDNWWRFMFGFPMIICFIRMLLVRFVFNLETPFFLIDKKRTAEAKDILSKIYIEKEVEGVFNTIQTSVSIIQKSKADKHANPIFEIFGRRYFLRFITGIIVGFANQLIAPVMMYSKPLFTNFLDLILKQIILMEF